MNEKSGYIERMGMVKLPYKIGKYSVGEFLKYRLWYNNELLAEKGTFEECAQVADEHEKGLKDNAIVSGLPLGKD